MTFDNIETLLRTLTPSRWTLRRKLRQEGLLSVRAFERVGLLSRDHDERVMVSWDTVGAEVTPAA